MSEETRGFAYLDLYVNDGKVEARISKNSRVRSVGAENTRMTNDPFATFAIDGFRGLNIISTDDLIAELLTRLTPEQVVNEMQYKFTGEQLLEMLKRKVK